MQTFSCEVIPGGRLICKPLSSKRAPARTQLTDDEEILELRQRSEREALEKGRAAAKQAVSKISRGPRVENSLPISFLGLLNRPDLWAKVIEEKFNGSKLDSKVWNITQNDSTGGFNSTLNAYNGNATGNIIVDDGRLSIVAKAEWYVQPVGCKNICESNSPDPFRVARPYTSGAINTWKKVDIDFGKSGVIDFKFRSSGGHGTQPTFWMYPKTGTSSPGPYGPWSSSGELDIMQIWHGPVGQSNAFGGPFNTPQGAIWFGGGFPDNALLFAFPTMPTDLTGTGWHTVEFSWDSKGLFVWKLDGIVNFIVGPSNYQVRFQNDNSTPLITNPYGSYISIVGNPVISQQPYQGVYVGYDDNGGFVPGGNLITTEPSPAPYVSSNPYFLMIELQVGGNAFGSIAPENGSVFGAGYNVDLSGVPDGPLSNYDAQQLGLPARPAAYFTSDQVLEVEYVNYRRGRF